MRTLAADSASGAQPFIDWAAFWKVAGVSALFGLAVVVLFALAVMGLSMAKGRVDDTDATAVQGDARVVGGRGVGSVIAGVCFVLCAAAVVYGLYLEIPQFH